MSHLSRVDKAYGPIFRIIFEIKTSTKVQNSKRKSFTLKHDQIKQLFASKKMLFFLKKKNCKSFMENTMKLVKSLKDGETKTPPLKAMNKHKEDSF